MIPIAIILSNCEINTQKARGEENYLSSHSYSIKTEMTIKGMDYLFITNNNGVGISINLTEDSLHCALLRKQLEKQ